MRWTISRVGADSLHEAEVIEGLAKGWDEKHVGKFVDGTQRVGKELEEDLAEEARVVLVKSADIKDAQKAAKGVILVQHGLPRSGRKISRNFQGERAQQQVFEVEWQNFAREARVE